MVRPLSNRKDFDLARRQTVRVMRRRDSRSAQLLLRRFGALAVPPEAESPIRVEGCGQQGPRLLHVAGAASLQEHQRVLVPAVRHVRPGRHLRVHLDRLLEPGFGNIGAVDRTHPSPPSESGACGRMS